MTAGREGPRRARGRRVPDAAHPGRRRGRGRGRGASGRWSTSCWSRSSPAGTCSSRTCPAPARRRWPGRSRPRSAASRRRIQFTPDLLPERRHRHHRLRPARRPGAFRPGPVFANVVLADEINRAAAKTQSALLEVMEEHTVTVDGEAHPVPDPFLVIATQNPIDLDGTYRLPEAQLDRFLVRTSLGYPDAEHEIEVLRPGSTAGAVDEVRAVTTPAEVARCLGAAGDAARRRPDPALRPRDRRGDPARRPGAARRQHPRAARARALPAGVRRRAGPPLRRPSDVQRLAEPVLAHRTVLTRDAVLAGHTTAAVSPRCWRRSPRRSPAGLRAREPVRSRPTARGRGSCRLACVARARRLRGATPLVDASAALLAWSSAGRSSWRLPARCAPTGVVEPLEVDRHGECAGTLRSSTPAAGWPWPADGDRTGRRRRGAGAGRLRCGRGGTTGLLPGPDRAGGAACRSGPVRLRRYGSRRARRRQPQEVGAAVRCGCCPASCRCARCRPGPAAATSAPTTGWSWAAPTWSGCTSTCPATTCGACTGRPAPAPAR